MSALLVLALASGSPPTTESSSEPAPVAAPSEVDPAARAAELFDAGEFLEAADAFENAYRATNDPAFVFGRAQALRRAGNCNAAIEEFERFIALDPPEPDVQEARDVIDACRHVLDIDARSAAVPTPQPPSIVDAPPPAPPPRPWWKDPAGISLFATGLGLAALGGGLLGGSFALARDRPAESEASFETRSDRVSALATSGYVILGTSGAILIASVVRFAVVAKRRRASAQARLGR